MAVAPTVRRRSWWRRLLILAVASVAAILFYELSQRVSARDGVQRLVATVDSSRLQAHVQKIAGFGPHPAGNEPATAAVIAWLEGELQTLGYTVTREPFEALTLIHEPAKDHDGYTVRAKQGIPHCNLIVEQRGTVEPDTVLEVGAHYDSVAFGPGADDNGSGVAALLEVARLLRSSPPQRTVRLLFYAMEEDGLVGSAAHVKQLRAGGKTIAGAIVLDMVGFATSAENSQQTPARVPLVFDPPTRGDFLVVAGNFRSGWLGNLYEACADAYVPAARYYSINRIASWFEDAVRSDHSSYWQAGIPAILLSDTAEMRNPNYHQKTDTAATIDLEFLRANTQALAATVLHWAGVP